MERTDKSDNETRPAIPAAVRLEVLTQAGHCCSVCGAEAALEFAHIKQWATTRNHDPENLVCLCSNCHARADREKWGYKALLWYRANPHVLRRSAGQPAEIQHRTSAKIVIDMPFDRFGKRERGLTHLALAKLLDVDLEAVELLDIDEGSVKITFRVPPDMPLRFEEPELFEAVKTVLPWLLDRGNAVIAALEADQLERSDAWTPEQPEFWAEAICGPFDAWPEEIRRAMAPFWPGIELDDTSDERELALPEDLHPIWSALSVDDQEKILDRQENDQAAVDDYVKKLIFKPAPPGINPATWRRDLSRLGKHLVSDDATGRPSIEEVARREAAERRAAREAEPSSRKPRDRAASLARVSKVLRLFEKLLTSDPRRAQRYLNDLVQEQEAEGTEPVHVAKTLSKAATVAGQKGRQELAETLYQRAVKTSPDDVVAQNGLAEVYKAQGKLDKAATLYEAARTRWPNDVVAQNGLA
ncbi:MAG: tetratricopeptide repeat protein, partial [Acidobacteriota bacterium]